MTHDWPEPAGAADATPAVSIGMPVYNDERYLPEALDSLLRQTFAGFELIISDNASTDATESICRGYARRDSRIRYVRHPRNRGQAANFEFLLREARGEWFMWAASDDRWDPAFIERLWTAATAGPGIAGAFSGYVFTDERGSVLGGARVFDYSGRSRLWRLVKLCWHYDDGCFYALFRRAWLDRLSIPRWWSINAATPYNLAYPVLCYVFSKGDLVLADPRPLWFNRLKDGAGHYVPFRDSRARQYAAMVVRKVNVFYESARSVYRATRSPVVTTLIAPALAARMLYDCVRPPVGFVVKRLRRLARMGRTAA